MEVYIFYKLQYLYYMNPYLVRTWVLTHNSRLKNISLTTHNIIIFTILRATSVL